MGKKSNFGKFLLLWSGELISSIGGGLTSFGLGVYIYDKTGSAAYMGLVTLLGFLPTLLLSVPAGVLADRYDRRLLMMLGDGFSALGVVFILICMMTGGAEIWQICIGVSVSSVFSALLEPSFKATITDLLTEDEYSKASGMVSIAGSARYLFSPILAGALLAIADIKLLLIIDICTFFLTVAAAAVVRKSISAGKKEAKEPFFESMKCGWRTLTGNKGILMLVLVSSFITMFMGMFQILAKPIVLSFTDASTLGTIETICASGMLVSSIIIGIKGIRNHYVGTLSAALALSGIFMAGFSLTEMKIPICICGFLFFAALPFANNCLDFLVRTNIPDELQGRTWGLIGFISQLGYIVAYSVSGVAADTLGAISGKGVGRGSAFVVLIAGICLSFISFSIPFFKKVRALEKNIKEQKTV